MIETIEQAGVAVLRMADGKVNAMSIDFCAAVTTKFEQLLPARAVVPPAPGGSFPPASICCDCSTAVPTISASSSRP